MKNNIIEISPLQARKIALCEAGVDSASFNRQRLVNDGAGSMYELSFTARGMCYSCYIDAIDGSVPGFFVTPDAA